MRVVSPLPAAGGAALELLRDRASRDGQTTVFVCENRVCQAPVLGIAPMMTRDHLKMARKKMFYSSAKAEAVLGYQPRPVRVAVEDAVKWFRMNGMLKG